MKKSLSTTLWFSIALTLLIACSDQGSELAISPSETPLILATIAATQTQPIPSRTPTDTQIPTLTPYPSKQVIFNYSFHGLVSLPFDDIFLDQPASKLVLYSDGQMLHFDEYYKQNYLTHDEIEQFLLKLKKMGFYEIESNQKHDPTDKLYDFGNKYEIEDIGLWYCIEITENPRKLCTYDPYSEFLIPEMKNILMFLDEYESEGWTMFQPDRIFLKVRLGRDPNFQNLPHKVIPWAEDFPSLDSNDNGVLFIEGKAASEIHTLLNSENIRMAGVQNGVEYSIEDFRPVLPHEVVSYP
jgi:hypothetical protein